MESLGRWGQRHQNPRPIRPVSEEFRMKGGRRLRRRWIRKNELPQTLCLPCAIMAVVHGKSKPNTTIYLPKFMDDQSQTTKNSEGVTTGSSKAGSVSLWLMSCSERGLGGTSMLKSVMGIWHLVFGMSGFRWTGSSCRYPDTGVAQQRKSREA